MNYSEFAPSQLKALCNRWHVYPRIPSADLTLSDVICAFQNKLEEIRAEKRDDLTETCDLYIEWQQTIQAYEEQIAQLQSSSRRSRGHKTLTHSDARQSQIKKIPFKRDKPGADLESEPLACGATRGTDPVQPGTDPVHAHFDDPSYSSSPSYSTDSDEDPYTALDPDLAEIALHLAEQTTAKSKLDTIPETDREAIFNLLQEHSSRRVAKVLQEPPPVGRNLKTSSSALDRFKRRYDNEKNYKDGLYNIDLVAKGDDKTERSVVRVIESLIKSRLLRRSADPRSTSQEIRILVQSLNSLRRQTMLERKHLYEMARKPLTEKEPT